MINLSPAKQMQLSIDEILDVVRMIFRIKACEDSFHGLAAREKFNTYLNPFTSTYAPMTVAGCANTNQIFINGGSPPYFLNTGFFQTTAVGSSFTLPSALTPGQLISVTDANGATCQKIIQSSGT